jgi:Outer membrane protein beta-barrel domain
VRKLAGIAAVLFVVGGSAFAQLPSGNVFIGYSYSNINSLAGSKNLNGWEASLEAKFRPWIGVVADFSGGYGSYNTGICAIGIPGQCQFGPTSVHRYTYMFGPRVSIPLRKFTLLRRSIPLGRFTLFAHALGGAAHINDQGSTDTSLAGALGGGFDYKLIRGITWRAQADIVHTEFFDVTGNNLRLSTGFDFRF